MAGDWAAYAQAWAQLDETVLRPLLARQQAGQSITLTLCGERGFVTLQSAGAGLMSWLTKLLRPHPWPLKEEL
jgi:hypothetical protein